MQRFTSPFPKSSSFHSLLLTIDSLHVPTEPEFFGTYSAIIERSA